jgi:sterol 3beta-glucosyltransferase
MRIAMIAPGVAGTSNPYIALGKGLKKVGHVVRLVTQQNSEQLVSSRGIEFWPVQGSGQDIAQSDEMRGRLEQGNFLVIMSQMAKEAQRGALAFAEGGLAACRGYAGLRLHGGLYPLFLAFPAGRGRCTSRRSWNNSRRPQGGCSLDCDSLLRRSAILGAARR